jgi:hypothetical protein
MNRFKLPQPYVPGMPNLLECKVPPALVPSVSEMEGFASQFNEREWTYLCKHAVFLLAVDGDLEEARVLAEAMLQKRFSSKVKLLKV